MNSTLSGLQCVRIVVSSLPPSRRNWRRRETRASVCFPSSPHDVQIMRRAELDLVDRPVRELSHLGHHHVDLVDADGVVGERRRCGVQPPQLIHRLATLLAPQVVRCLVQSALGERVVSQGAIQLLPQRGRIFERHAFQLGARSPGRWPCFGACSRSSCSWWIRRTRATRRRSVPRSKSAGSPSIREIVKTCRSGKSKACNRSFMGPHRWVGVTRAQRLVSYSIGRRSRPPHTRSRSFTVGSPSVGRDPCPTARRIIPRALDGRFLESQAGPQFLHGVRQFPRPVAEHVAHR